MTSVFVRHHYLKKKKKKKDTINVINRYFLSIIEEKKK